MNRTGPEIGFRVAIIYVLIVGAIFVFRAFVDGGASTGPAPATESIWYKAD